ERLVTIGVDHVRIGDRIYNPVRMGDVFELLARSVRKTFASSPVRHFSSAARTDRAAGIVPTLRRVCALLPRILSPPPPSPSPGDGGRRRGKSARLANPRRAGPCGRGKSVSGRLAYVSVRPPGPNDRLSVWGQPRPQAPSTLYASSVRHTSGESPPIERT